MRYSIEIDIFDPSWLIMMGPGPGPGPGFSLQQIKCPSLPVKLVSVAVVLGTGVRVPAESESFQVGASGSQVVTECPVQSQETLLKKFFQQTVGPLHCISGVTEIPKVTIRPAFNLSSSSTMSMSVKHTPAFQ